MSFQDEVLDKIARVVGGNVSPSDPHFFNGGGVAGLVGCYSVAPDQVDQTPVGIVVIDQFTAQLETTGEEDNEDLVRLLILVAPYKLDSQLSKLTPYRDTVPAAFRSHMGLFASPGALDAFVTAGRAGIHEWRGTPFLTYEFTVRVRRGLSVSYTP